VSLDNLSLAAGCAIAGKFRKSAQTDAQVLYLTYRMEFCMA